MSAENLSAADVVRRMEEVRAAVERCGGHVELLVRPNGLRRIPHVVKPHLRRLVPASLAAILDQSDIVDLHWTLPEAEPTRSDLAVTGACALSWALVTIHTMQLGHGADVMYGPENGAHITDQCVAIHEWSWEDELQWLCIDTQPSGRHLVRLLGSSAVDWEQTVIADCWDSFLWHWAELGFPVPRYETLERYLGPTGLLDSRMPESVRWKQYLFGQV